MFAKGGRLVPPASAPDGMCALAAIGILLGRYLSIPTLLRTTPSVAGRLHSADSSLHHAHSSYLSFLDSRVDVDTPLETYRSPASERDREREREREEESDRSICRRSQDRPLALVPAGSSATLSVITDTRYGTVPSDRSECWSRAQPQSIPSSSRTHHDRVNTNLLDSFVGPALEMD